MSRFSRDQNHDYYEIVLDRSLPDRDRVPFKCIFHDDHTPSATVFLDSGGFNCNGCGAKGSIIDFEMRRSGCADRATAYRNIAKIVGAEIGNLNRPNWRFIDAYVYRDVPGRPVFRKLRWLLPDGKKQFTYEHYCDGRWVTGLDPASKANDAVPKRTPRLLYNEHLLVTANLVLRVEGEKCADLLSIYVPKLFPKRQANGLRIVVTTNCEGASEPGKPQKWLSEYNKSFSKKVVIGYEDNDPSGRALAEYAAAQIHPFAEEVRNVTFRDQREKYDIGDWIEEHRDDSEIVTLLEQMIESAPLYQPGVTASTPNDHGYSLISLADLFKKPDVPLNYVWDGRLVAGTLSCMVAKPKVGKGTMARNLSLAVARGEVFLGTKCTQGEVVYLALEEREEEIKADFRAMGATGDEPIHIHAAPAPEAAVPEVIVLVRERRPALLVIDPLIRLARIRDEKAYAETYAALGPLIDVARECGTHILLLHHSSKVAKADAIDSPLGSTAFGGIPATLIYLKRNAEGMRTIQTVQRIGDDLPESVLIFDKAAKKLGLGGTRNEAERAAAEKRILQFLDEAKEPQTQGEIRESVEGDTRPKRAALTSLLKTNKVKRTGTGKKGNPFRYKTASGETIH